ncbi:aminomethyl-transferring glycine dehydrogenase subunit GcvPB [Methylocystis sp. MJC1]|jgi:glycine dehydrogenase subunit 2|uniref:aminomethyl-transferring glycine dehydrogenase subunit GcvPB n=1 Tax=Methylocystis sp. MJC1 TaxID=2654282 RepID=UPI0013E9C3FE|nr:aminomethyl-transferring glycine dehydrogenase subunit GcvPB [Methylocystis sp. MJC1]KAF2989695.1 putative glycine dehydrogenase (decarboxylating) subunit 2 [Methylocystis sp. MJC1]MBU6525597.1 aminomethyl-transferring glycine dehydrogenase subunit GcvPB [Methylocystis sp. MJC1]UZX12073.1 aminomethyl-transferring glycine dehydrogenase subunit GcvPB [Methylocystis sp. MJC1]
MLDRPAHIDDETPETFTGNRALDHEEPLLFEIGRTDATGVDVEEPPQFAARLGGLERKDRIGLPGLSEPEAMRHYVRLSRKNYSIDAGLYPLGSCTMKHNPRANEKLARLEGFADLHPLQPMSSVQGALELMETLAHWLLTLTNMQAIALSPKAGAHGELCGMMAIKSAVAARGEGATRNVVLIPQSAHGTNPATAALLGFSVRVVPGADDGTVRAAAVQEALGPDVAALMLTNPNTCGLFEREIVEIAEAVHEAGAYFYCDGANFNAIAGVARPGDFGVDAMHINLHKTFSTPHGGGGPGAGPVVLSERLAPFAPVPFLRRNGETLALVEHAEGTQSFGRMTAFHGQMGMFVRALAYLLAHGGDGVAQASKDAVLSANYVRASLRDVMTQPFGDRLCMHEVLFDDAWLKGTGVSTLDFAKAMIDEGYHPMTIYFPLVAHGAMLIEPTESESKASLDLFIATLRDLAKRAKEGDAKRFTQAPRFAPRRRVDETLAARKPVLRWCAESPSL